MSRTLGIGLAGAGRFGAFCVEAFRDLPGARVVAVMDTDRSRAGGCRAARRDGPRRLRAPACRPGRRHRPYRHAAIPPRADGPPGGRGGKHVFVEKPLATTMDEALAAVDAATASGVQLSIDYVLRHHPLHRLAIDLTRSDALGGLQHFALENFASSEALPADHWFWDPARSGGIHVEHGVHFFDLCLALVGKEPDAVSGTAQRRSDGRTDRVAALLRFGDQTTATFFHAFNRTSVTERTTIRLAFRTWPCPDRWLDPDESRAGRHRCRSVHRVRSVMVPGWSSRWGRRRSTAWRPSRPAPRCPIGREPTGRPSGPACSTSPPRSRVNGHCRVTPADAVRSLKVAIRATP